MKETILTHLARIENHYGVEILFAVEAGSRAWGFHSDDSDYDVRFVYRRPLTWYLSIHDRRDVIEPKTDFPLDISGWDIRKALYQMHRGNPQFCEWLYSPVTYRAGPELPDLQRLQVPYFNPRSAIYHYLHMASGNYRDYIKDNDTPRLKKYLYVVRPLFACMWIERHHTMPPVDFDTLFNFARHETGTPRAAVDDLITAKRLGGELGEASPITSLNDWIDDRLAHFSVSARTTAKGSAQSDDLDEYFYTVAARSHT